MALVVQAFNLRETPYLVDAIDAIVAAYERAPLDRLEQQLGRNARLVRLLRETDPACTAGRS